MQIIILLWYVCTFVQSLLGIGTAYRLTKGGGDNGVSLWGWLLLMNLAALVPGLGFALWNANRDDTPSPTHYNSSYYKPRPNWMQQDPKTGKLPEGPDLAKKQRQEMTKKMNDEIKRNEKNKGSSWFDIGNPYN